jgi:hypothetical protein
MKYVKLFEEYAAIVETISLPVLRDVNDFVSNLLTLKRKEKVITNLEKDYYGSTLKKEGFYIPGYIHVYKYQGKNYSVLSGAKPNDGKLDLGFSNIKEFSVFILGEGKPSKEMIDNVFEYQVEGTNKNSEIVAKRKSIKVITDFEIDTEKIKDSSKVIKNPIVIEIVYGFKTTPVTKFDVTTTPEYKKFLEETGLDMISTPQQVKNGTISLAFPAAYAYPDEKDNRQFKQLTQDKEGKPQEYLINALQISTAGYIRKVPGFNPGYEIRPAVVSKFSVTPQGWLKALEICREIWQKMKADWEKKGIYLIDTEEERHQKRGKIAGKKFGF